MSLEVLVNNTIIVDALIDGKSDVLLKMLRGGLDVNVQVELRFQDLVEAWERRLVRHYGVVPYPDDLYTQSELDELNTIEMVYHMGLEFHHPTPATIEKVPLLIATIRLEVDEIVLKLLDLNVEVNIRDTHGCSPLIYAVEKKNSLIVQLLIEHGADPNIWTNAGRSPLLAALLSRNEKNVRALIGAGANVGKLDTEGFYASAIDLSISTGQYGCFLLLLEEEADLEYIDNHGNNLLDTCLNALKSKKFSHRISCSIFWKLLEGGATIDNMKCSSKIPGDFYRYGSCNLLKMMLEYGMRVCSKGATQNTMPVLHEASCNPNVEVLQFLVNKLHIDLETRDEKGRTVLLFACSEFPLVTFDKIKLLVDHGSNLHAVDQYNKGILESCITSSYVADIFVWLMKRASLIDIMKILPLLIQYDHIAHLKQVYKRLAVLNFKDKLMNMLQSIEKTQNYNYFVQCRQELEKMRTYPIGNRKLSDFIGIHEYSRIARKSELIEIFFAKDLSDTFPIYWCDIVVDLKEAALRQQLISNAMKGIIKITGFLYKSCPMFLDQLIYHLTKIDLENLSHV